jgi:hypothetical protein
MGSVLPKLSLIWSRFTNTLIYFENLSTQHIQAQFNVPETDLYVHVAPSSCCDCPGPCQVEVVCIRRASDLEIPMVPGSNVAHHVEQALRIIVLLLMAAFLAALFLKVW